MKLGFNFKKKHKRIHELYPDEILLDTYNLPAFDKQQFEGRLERPISKRTLSAFFSIVVVISLGFFARLVFLQVVKHGFYAKRSEQNSLEQYPIIADRGIIYDRHGVELAWNVPDEITGRTVRAYISDPGFANTLGYVAYPAKDTKGRFWREEIVGRDGVEKEFNDVLSGTNGRNLVETNVAGEVLSESMVERPIQGENLTLAIDAEVQKALAQGIMDLAHTGDFVGGAGAVMDIRTGELIAFTTYPEYSQKTLAEGKDTKTIQGYFTSSGRPFLNRVLGGLYTPGSIVKPFLALAALHENVIDPNKVLYTTGSLKIPNPYNPKLFTIFKDNANHGAVDMREAIAVSSNVYFYEVGGGFGDQKGLGITNIEKYTKLFGIGSETGVNIAGEIGGTVPSVAWKEKYFPGDQWRIGDTYNTSIGQYGFQVTPIQMLRAVAGIASRGTLVTPTVLATHKPAPPTGALPFTDAEYTVVHEAMRRAVTKGTAQLLQNEIVHVAAKTGTAQIKNNTRVNSWVIGFFPYEAPRFAFVTLMENGPTVTAGAPHAFAPVIAYYAAHSELLTEK